MEEAKQSIERKIKSQYNLWNNATSAQLSEQQHHIDTQQKEIADRLALIESKEKWWSTADNIAKTDI